MKEVFVISKTRNRPVELMVPGSQVYYSDKDYTSDYFELQEKGYVGKDYSNNLSFFSSIEEAEEYDTYDKAKKIIEEQLEHGYYQIEKYFVV